MRVRRTDEKASKLVSTNFRKLKKDFERKMENLLTKTYYAGERIRLIGKKGSKGVLVSPEDFDFLEKVEKLLSGACHAGERVVLTSKEGDKVGIVSLEDLQLLEKLAP